MGLHIPRGYTVLFWIYCFIIGAITGLVAFGVTIGVSYLFQAVSSEIVFKMVDTSAVQVKDVAKYCLYNLAAVVAGAALVLGITPLAAGSGIPNMYAYLNGIDMPEFLSLKVALAKIPGSVLVVSGGLTIGKEGPLLHIGSIVATFLGSTGLFKSLEKTRDQDAFTYQQHTRDLVACGAAAGLAAGFKAPVGGVLFAMEMASRWRPELTWRTLFTCAVVSTIVRAGVYLEKDVSWLSYGSLIFFGDEIHFSAPYHEVGLMAILGAIGGFVGCMFTSLNMYIGSFRWRYRSRWAIRLVEAAVVSLLTSALRASLPLLGNCLEKACESKEDTTCAPGVRELQRFGLYGCAENEYNDLAVLMYNPQGFVVKALFTTDLGGFEGKSLLIFTLFYFFMSALAYGMAIPAGLFTPSVITGGALGQLYALLLNKWFGWKLDAGLYAFLGAGAVLGGMFRFAVSFVVILTELTNTEAQLPFLMLVLVVAKGVGDRFNQNILNHLCILLGLPYIGGHPESTIRRKGFQARDIMNRRMTTFDPIERRSNIEAALQIDDYDVFPVVRRSKSPFAEEEFLGMVTAHDLEGLLKKTSEERTVDTGPCLNGTEFEMVDLTNIIRMPPVIIPPSMPLTSVFRVKNATGLEYIPVLDSHGPLRGMITRHELVECQNRVIDPDNLQERLDKLTKETFLERTRTLQPTVSSDLAHLIPLLPETAGGGPSPVSGGSTRLKRYTSVL